MIKVLHVVSALSGGGVESMLYNYYKHIYKSEIRFDFIVHDKNEGILEKDLREYGSNIYHVTPKKVNPIKNFIEIQNIIKNGKYDIVHCHQNFSSGIPLFIAMLNNVKTRIAHAHTAFNCLDNSDSYVNKIMRFVINNTATHFCACTKEAARFIYGDKLYNNKKIFFIKNAIDTEKFSYNENFRNEIRKEFNVENKIVIGNVGRLCEEKNHAFLIEIFAELQKILPNSILMIVGKGEKEILLKKEINERLLKDKVIFTGERLDVNKIMCAMDIFILPSLFEGLGISLIEAQSVGLKCIASEGVIPNETNITKLISYISLDEDKAIWAEKVVEKLYLSIEEDPIKKIKSNGYDISTAASEMILFYKNIHLNF